MTEASSGPKRGARGPHRGTPRDQTSGPLCAPCHPDPRRWRRDPPARPGRTQLAHGRGRRSCGPRIPEMKALPQAPRRGARTRPHPIPWKPRAQAATRPRVWGPRSRVQGVVRGRGAAGSGRQGSGWGGGTELRQGAAAVCSSAGRGGGSRAPGAGTPGRCRPLVASATTFCSRRWRETRLSRNSAMLAARRQHSHHVGRWRG